MLVWSKVEIKIIIIKMTKADSGAVACIRASHFESETPRCGGRLAAALLLCVTDSVWIMMINNRPVQQCSSSK